MDWSAWGRGASQADRPSPRPAAGAGWTNVHTQRVLAGACRNAGAGEREREGAAAQDSSEGGTGNGVITSVVLAVAPGSPSRPADRHSRGPSLRPPQPVLLLPLHLPILLLPWPLPTSSAFSNERIMETINSP